MTDDTRDVIDAAVSDYLRADLAEARAAVMPWETVVSKGDLGTVHALAQNVAGYMKTELFTKIENALARSPR